MKKVIQIQEMTCEHCRKNVERALGEIEDVTDVKVNLKKQNAVVNFTGDVDDKKLIDAVTDAGYVVSSISEKKGWFWL